jgi:hypothetical protein
VHNISLYSIVYDYVRASRTLVKKLKGGDYNSQTDDDGVEIETPVAFKEQKMREIIDEHSASKSQQKQQGEHTHAHTHPN